MKNVNSKLVVIISLIVILALASLTSATNYFVLNDYQIKWSGANGQNYGEGHVKVPTKYVVTGIALGSYDLNDYKEGDIGNHVLRPIAVYTRELFHDGTLGNEKIVRIGSQRNIERSIRLPYGYVMTGWGAGINSIPNKNNWVVDYLEITARKINTNGYLEAETLFVNKTLTGTLDTKVKLNDGYVATLISGVVYKGTIDVAKVGGKRLTVNGNTIPTGNNNTNNSQNNQPTISSVSVLGNKSGDLFRIIVNASDPDNDPLTITYSSPFNSSGMWQTNNNSAGTYTTSVSVSDGKITTSFLITFTVQPNQDNNQTNTTNHAPIISMININGQHAGDLFKITVNAWDQDNDALTYYYSNPFNASGMWQTTNNTQSGSYPVTVTVSDGKANSSLSFNVYVHQMINNQSNNTNNTNNTNVTNQTNTTNHAPSINSINIYGHYVGDLFKIVVNASDLDNNTLTYSYSNPFNASGMWQTNNNTPNGTYQVNVSVSDGMITTMWDLDINVFALSSNLTNQTNMTNHTNHTNMTNRAPIIRGIHYTGDEEGDNFRIIVDAYDPEGNSLTTTCSSPFNNNCRWQTHNGDDGDYDVRVTISDGNTSLVRHLTVTVEQEGSRDSSPSSTISHVGEFQDNDLALNNRLYEDLDYNANTISLNSNDGAYQLSSTSKVSTVINLTIVLLILILVAILAIILALINRR